ncbi:MAG: hypothetical protein RLZZ347_330 [Candidatus Parcubacteria bacterium]|jgi:uncharacterized protein YneF (UPF0154 family)
MNTIKSIYRALDKFEDMVRGKLSHHPIPYAFLGGVAIVLFWRGVWHLADALPYIQNSWVSIGVSSVIMLSTGLFVSFFIGDRIILSGLKHEHKVADQTESEVAMETTMLASVDRRLNVLETQLKDIKALLDKKSQ